MGQVGRDQNKALPFTKIFMTIEIIKIFIVYNKLFVINLLQIITIKVRNLQIDSITITTNLQSIY